MRRGLLFLFAPLFGLALAVPCHATVRHASGELVSPYLARQPLRHASFDWDDNIAVMCTRVYLLSRTGAPELALSTAEWAHAKHLVGRPGPLEDRYLDPDKKTGAFRDLGENGRENLFLRDLKRTLASQRDWRGPSWQAFVRTLSTREGARRSSIITAREHLPESIHEGLRYLQSTGHIRHVPVSENIYAVSRPGVIVGGEPLVGTTPERKLAVQRVLLDGLEREAQASGHTSHWHFSDDDWDNYAATRDGLGPDVRGGRWPHVAIKLHFTGLDHAINEPEWTRLLPPAL